MAPVIHLVRHAQGYHNLNFENQWLKDPDLTEFGKKQCEELCNSFPYHDKVTHLVASPIRRTLFTCQLSFPRQVAAGKKIIALQDCQEVSLYPSDVGSDLGLLKEEFGDLVDFRFVTEDWNRKAMPDSKYYPEPGKLEARARNARRWLRDLVRDAGDDDAHVVVVTHGAILHFLTEDWSGIRPGNGTGWKNTEYRSYEFADKTGQDLNASIEELPESLRRRRGSEIPLTAEEKLELRAAYEEKTAQDLQLCLERTAQREVAVENGTNGA